MRIRTDRALMEALAHAPTSQTSTVTRCRAASPERAAVSLSTHLLDLTAGLPAGGVRVRLEREDGTAEGRPTVVADTVTDVDGRVPRLAAATPAGRHRIVVDAGDYFAARGQPSFFPQIVIAFEISDPDAHYHVPVLMSPFGYSTYRGS